MREYVRSVRSFDLGVQINDLGVNYSFSGETLNRDAVFRSVTQGTLKTRWP